MCLRLQDRYVYNFLIHFSVRSNSATLVQGDLACDVNKTAQRIINEAVGVWGRLDVLVNNAAQFYPTHLGSVTEKDWADLIQANLTSPFFLSQVCWNLFFYPGRGITYTCKRFIELTLDISQVSVLIT